LALRRKEDHHNRLVRIVEMRLAGLVGRIKTARVEKLASILGDVQRSAMAVVVYSFQPWSTVDTEEVEARDWQASKHSILVSIVMRHERLHDCGFWCFEVIESSGSSQTVLGINGSMRPLKTLWTSIGHCTTSTIHHLIGFTF
jgi:hypothetical protein